MRREDMVSFTNFHLAETHKAAVFVSANLNLLDVDGVILKVDERCTIDPLVQRKEAHHYHPPDRESLSLF